MIFLYVICVVVLVLVVLQPVFTRIGARRLERDRLELQALYGQVVSELRADAYYKR